MTYRSFATIASLTIGLAIGTGCSTKTTALEVNVKMVDPVFPAAATVRLIISATDGTAFPMEVDPTTLRTGMTERNVDIDGDGAVDIVIEFGTVFPLNRDNKFRLTPKHLTQPLHVSLRVDVLDHLANRIARLGGHDPSLEHVDEVLAPNQLTVVKELEPACITDCTGTAQHTTMDATAITFGGGALGAIAAGNLTGAATRRVDLAVASSHDDRTDLTPVAHNAGQVVVYFGGATLSMQPDVTILGAAAGGQLGASLAIGDLDGDGADDLVIGSPGANNTAGAVYVLYGTGTWPANIDLGSASPTLGAIAGVAVGDRLGEALALADVDGDGHLDVLAGAPGASTVYALRSANLPRAGSGDIGQASSLRGPAGSEFGRYLATRQGTVAVTAPLIADSNNMTVGAAYVFAANAINAAAVDASTLPRILGNGGGLGTSLTFADVDASGKLSLAIAAPETGTGIVSLFPIGDLPAGDTLVSSAKRSLRATAPNTGLGAAVGWLKQPLGEALVVGAPSTTPASSQQAGVVYIVGAPTMGVLPLMLLTADGQPAASAISGDRAGDAFGTQLIVDDFTQDGISDLVVGAAGAKTIYLFQGPLL